jgi:hypothetical protein
MDGATSSIHHSGLGMGPVQINHDMKSSGWQIQGVMEYLRILAKQ